jgi:diacylglycerol kinase (ATP)
MLIIAVAYMSFMDAYREWTKFYEKQHLWPIQSETGKMESSLQIKLIINPVAGRISADKTEEIIEFFQRNHAQVSFESTGKPHDATSISERAAREGFDTIVAVGGDGTVNEVLNGMAGADIPLGIIPLGSSNDFAQGLHIPIDTREACKCIMASNTKKIDIGKINNRYFINIAGVGLDANVSEAANAVSTRAKGMAPYFLALLKVLIRSNPRDYSLTLDGKTKRVKAWLISIGNGSQYGGGMRILPTADTADGYFDICVIKDIDKWRIFYYLPLLIKGKHLSLANVAVYRAKEIEVKGLGCLGHADGEVLKGDVFKFELLPQALSLIVPTRLPA